MPEFSDSHLSSPWNYAVAYLSMHYGAQELASGSCFFWSAEGRTFLVTNWHNLSGRNHLTQKPLSKTSALPDRLLVLVYRRTSEPDELGFFELKPDTIEVKLCDSDLTAPKWIEHPVLTNRVDVGAIDITDLIDGLDIRGVNVVEHDAVLDPWSSQDVFIVGFPFGLIKGVPAPMWKRGTIALDPTFNPEDMPKLLIDTATREGMSGSVVIARHTILGKGYLKKDGTMNEPVVFATFDVVLGIYSGRHYPDLEKAQLGIVWKRSVIEEIVSAGTPPNS